MGRPRTKTAEIDGFCVAIRRCRESLGKTQREFAALLGVAPNTVARWEAGRIPERSYIEKLADFMGSEWAAVATPKCLQPTRIWVVNFSMSETEYRELQAEVARVGARSMGDYIRECVSAAGPGGIGDRITRIERLLTERLGGTQ